MKLPMSIDSDEEEQWGASSEDEAMETRSVSSESMMSSQYQSSQMGSSSATSDIDNKLGKKESNQLFWIRLLLFGVLLAGTMLGAFFMHRVTRQGEKDRFDTDFRDNGMKLLDIFEERLLQMVASIDNYAVVSTTSAGNEDDWPLVRAPFFEVRGASTTKLSRASMLMVLPMVRDEIREGYEAFTVNNTQWIEEGRAFERTFSGSEVISEGEGHVHDRDHGPNEGLEGDEDFADFSSGISSTIFSLREGDYADVVNPIEDMYLPVWQHTPVNPTIVNYNLMKHSWFGADIRQSIETTQIVFGLVADVSSVQDPFHSVYRPATIEAEQEEAAVAPVDDDKEESPGHAEHGEGHAEHGARDEAHKEEDKDESPGHVKHGAKDEAHNEEDKDEAPGHVEHGGNDEVHNEENKDEAPGHVEHGGNDEVHNEENKDEAPGHVEHGGNDEVHNEKGPDEAEHGEDDELHNEESGEAAGHTEDGATDEVEHDGDNDEVVDHDQHNEDLDDHGGSGRVLQRLDHHENAHDDASHGNGNEEEQPRHGNGGNHGEHNGEATDDKCRDMMPIISSDQGTDVPHHRRMLQPGCVDYGDPASMIFFPIFNHIDEPRNLVGILAAVVHWSDFLQNALAPQGKPIDLVLSNSCGQAFTYRVTGEDVRLLGEGDQHERRFDCDEDVELFKFVDIQEQHSRRITFSGVQLNSDYCPYVLSVHPTTEMEDYYLTRKPMLYAIMIVAIFVFAWIVFVLYDSIVIARQRKVSRRAAATSAVVNSLFPANVRERLFKAGSTDAPGTTFMRRAKMSDTKDLQQGESLPIADLFPHSTVLFADIAGFTAWSSTREPTQVFMLLETIYGKFDALARSRRVFKVETIGDCYVAATGVPDNQKDHAVRMATFANLCLHKVSVLTKKLESTLGPDTGDLQMRFGIHSGPVTAGVLRGEKSRFQLFGDTVNTASRMESTGRAGRIQCSLSTAKLLMKAGKDHWLEERPETVHAKGKGAIQTFWLNPILDEGSLAQFENNSSEGVDPSDVVSTKMLKGHVRKEKRSEKEKQLVRLIEWNVDVLKKQLCKHMSARRASSAKASPITMCESGRMPLEDVKEAVTLKSESMKNAKKATTVDTLTPKVEEQLREYITTIAGLYHIDNPFHNFDHASHVSLSATKMLSRIVEPERRMDDTASSSSTSSYDNQDKEFAIGISSDPLTHFAIAFATMIHDVDHNGVSNFQLIQEGSSMAKLYKNKSVAEQNSIDIAWDLLMEPTYEELRNCIFMNQAEHDRFRSLLVNCVIATDIFDKDQKEFRQQRWDKAFGKSTKKDGAFREEDEEARNNLKATIVIEHLIQASDVAHTMQHWRVYQRWNERLFAEMYKAHHNGRMEKDPSVGWYKGELWFFDNYVIPLAKKLFECNVFGVSSDEYLQYATENRHEWEITGEELVQEWVKKYKVDYASTEEGSSTASSSNYATDDMDA